MVKRLWLPFILATVAFSLAFAPAMYLTDEGSGVSEASLPPSDQGPAHHHRPLLSGDSIRYGVFGDAFDVSTDHAFDNALVINRPRQPRFISIISCLGCFFLFQLARDSTNFVIPWVSLRFNESMAHVR